jgi:hypothetical protein
MSSVRRRFLYSAFSGLVVAGLVATAVTVTASRAKGEALSAVYCNRAAKSAIMSYSTTSTRSNTFSFSDSLAFSTLAGLFTANVSGSVSSSTTSTQGISVGAAPHSCVRIFALRDKYAYTLQTQCRFACSKKYYGGKWIRNGSGVFSKFIGRASYDV